MRHLTAPLLSVLTAVLAACGGGADDTPPEDAPPGAVQVAGAASWTAADDLFHRGDPRWLGSDAAYSIDLRDGRVLWLFGDTFVATSAANSRSASEMVRNTVAVQDRPDPLTAGFAPAWRTDAASTPASYFPEVGDRWHWPLHGVRFPQGPLVMFWSILRPTPGEGFGFAGDGWRLAIVDDPSAAPATWTVRTVEAPASTVDAVVGTAVAFDGDHVVAIATADADSHATYLARWSRPDLAAGNLGAIEWWQNGRWVAATALAGQPSALFGEGATEASLHHDAALDTWIYVYSRGFGATTVAIRTSPRPEGPWSAPVDAFTPPESRAPGPSSTPPRPTPS